MAHVLERVSTGLEPLDEILSGGLLRSSAYLVRGGPGQGKTTLGLHFLTAAEKPGTALFIGFQEPEEQLRANAATVGIDVSGVRFLSLAPDERFFAEHQAYDVFSAADVEGEPLAESVLEAVERYAPTRVFIDSMTQLRFLSADVYQYRKQVLSLLRYLRERGATVLFSSERGAEHPDDDLQFLADGVITLESSTVGSTLEVSKLRGSAFRRGAHQVRVGPRGLEVFPRPLPPRSEVNERERLRWKSGVERLDEILHGGIEAETVTLITGPSGAGKSTLASLFVAHAAQAGRNAAMYVFEEEISSVLARARALRIPLRDGMRDGRLTIEQVEPMRYLADEFAARVRRKVEEEQLDVVVLDSIAGYQLTLEGQEAVKGSIHAFAKSLARIGASVFLINEVEAVTGDFKISEKGISYVSDNVILLRFMEEAGELKKVVGVLKKRMSGFDPRLYTFEVGPVMLSIGEPVGSLQGEPNGRQRDLREPA